MKNEQNGGGNNGNNGNRENRNKNNRRNRFPQNQNRERPQKQNEQVQRQNRPDKRNNAPAPANRQGGKNEKGNNADQNRKDTYVYALDGNLYINLTNKCSNGCLFCVRNERASYFGHYLWLRHGDPTAEKVIGALNGFGDLKRYKEIVFCGFGEPTYKMNEMLAVAEYAHLKGLTTRLNTNGQGNLINNREIAGELKGKIDKINISLNASSAEKYKPICRPMYGEAGYTAILDFARGCKRLGIECWFSVVDNIGEEEVAACKRVAESIGIPLRVRKYISES